MHAFSPDVQDEEAVSVANSVFNFWAARPFARVNDLEEEEGVLGAAGTGTGAGALGDLTLRRG